MPDTKLYELVDKMAKCIYPVTIEIDRQNKIIAIVNHQEIVTRSKEVIENLSHYFEGDIANEYFSTFEKHCSDPNIIIDGLGSELFYQLLFLPIYTQYTDALITSFIMPSLGNVATALETTVILMPYYNEKDKVIADVHGKNNEATFIARYQLYAEDHTIFSITGNTTYDKVENKKRNMEFEIYHIDPENRRVDQISSFAKDRPTHKEEQTSIIVEERPSKKSFWNIFH